MYSPAVGLMRRKRYVNTYTWVCRDTGVKWRRVLINIHTSLKRGHHLEDSCTCVCAYTCTHVHHVHVYTCMCTCTCIRDAPTLYMYHRGRTTTMYVVNVQCMCSPVSDNFMCSWLVFLPDEGWLIRVFLHMAVQAVLWERGYNA